MESTKNRLAKLAETIKPEKAAAILNLVIFLLNHLR